ncbi:MAG TPA: hypothetical protein VGR48_10475 [Terriglobales bacterium]|nr:hypothetical protein [Terriglobales bacterium]
MQIQDLLNTYQAKSDEELLQLAAASEHLTPEARMALESELSRREIHTTEHLRVVKHDKGRETTGRTTEKLQRGESQSVGEFVAEVLRAHHCHFWLFFRITAPAVVVATIAVIMARDESRDIVNRLLRGHEFTGQETDVLRIWLFNLTASFVSWTAFAFSFGAICIALRDIETDTVPSAADCYVGVRGKLSVFLRLSAILFIFAIVAMGAALFLSMAVFWGFRQGHIFPNSITIRFVSYTLTGLALLVLSRFSLSVPAVVVGNCRIAKAIFRSDELTEGKWLTLAAILTKSLIGSYIAAFAPFWLASRIIPVRSSVPFWLPWALTLVSMAGVTAVEPTMFVGFALLYLKTSPSRCPSSTELTREPA